MIYPLQIVTVYKGTKNECPFNHTLVRLLFLYCYDATKSDATVLNEPQHIVPFIKPRNPQTHSCR
jgi:hypothetical protein